MPEINLQEKIKEAIEQFEYHKNEMLRAEGRIQIMQALLAESVQIDIPVETPQIQLPN